MPKLPMLKARKIIRILKKMGFFEFHRVGSHAQFKHPDGRRTTIPIHPGKDIPRGTLRAILRDIDITPDNLIKALKK